MTEAFERVVVEVDVRGLAADFFEAVRIDREAVVLAGDLDLAGVQVLHRLIAAAMAELELECLGAQRQAQQLVAEADAEDRQLAVEVFQLTDRVVSQPRDRPGRWKRTGRRACTRGSARRWHHAAARVTSQPLSTRLRRMLCLAPQSSATTL